MARRRHVWVPRNVGASVAGGASSQSNILAALTSDVEALGGLTVVRIVGEFKYRCDVVNVFQQFSAGIGVFHEDRTIDAGNLMGEENNEWMWTLHTRTSNLFAEVASGVFQAGEETRSIDITVKRKLPAQNVLTLFVANDATNTVSFFLGVRMLVLLP